MNLKTCAKGTKLRVYTLINHIIKKYELRVKITKTHRSTSSLIIKFWNWLNISLQRVNCVLVPYVYYNKHQVLGSMTYYPLYVDSSWTSVRNLTRQCYHLLRLPLKSLSYKSPLLCDQMTYYSSKEHMSNSTKGITMVIDFMITCTLDHPMGHVVSIPCDIMVPLLRIPITTSLHR